MVGVCHDAHLENLPHQVIPQEVRYMLQSKNILAAFYFIAFIVCFLVFFAKRSWGYLVAAVCWLMIGIYCLVRKDDDL